MIAGRLGMKRFAAACDKEDASTESLRNALKNRRISAVKAIIWSASIALIVIAVIMVVGRRHYNTVSISEPTPEPPVSSTPVALPAESAALQPVAPPTPAIDTAWIATVIAEHLGNDDENRLRLLAMLDSDTIPYQEKKDSVNAYLLNYLAAQGKILYIAGSRYSDISDIDVQKAVRNHPEWLRLEKEQKKLLNRLPEFYESRRFQRSSDHPALPPDTIPDASLPAPHH